jgi:endonuclease III
MMVSAVEPRFLESTLERITEILVQEYDTPDLGNLPDPLDELVFIITTFKTNDSNFRRVFASLRQKFPTWRDLMSAPLEKVKSVLKPAGLSNQKAPRRIEILKRINKEHGSLSLDFLHHLPDQEVENYLRSFDGVGKKGARCIMMYSLDRQAFPVDTHTLRIFKRLGLLDWTVKPKPAQDIIQDMVPMPLRMHLHVNLVVHGRTTCLARNPKCDQCCIAKDCNAYINGEFRRSDR